MKWNAFDLISLTFDKTKQRVFPFKFKEWFRLGIISLLAGNGNTSFNSSWGGNSGGGNSGGGLNFEDLKQKIREGINKYWGIGALIFGVFFILGAIWSYIQSVFQFILVEAVINKEARFTFKKNSSKGASLFLFRFFISIITLIVIGGLVAPYIYHFMNANPIIQSVGIPYIIFSIIALIVYLIILFILFLFLYDLVVPYMYAKGTNTIYSLKKIWENIRKNKTETFVYWIARLVMGVAVGIIAGVIGLLLGLIFLVIGGVILGIGAMIYSLIGGNIILIILGIVIISVLIIVFMLALATIVAPLTVFVRLFGLFNFEKLTGIKILRN